MNELFKKGLIYFNFLIVIGKIVGENIKDMKVKDYNVIRLIDNLYFEIGGFVIVRGNFVLDGVVVKKSVVLLKFMKYRGFVCVFESGEEVFEVILKGKI